MKSTGLLIEHAALVYQNAIANVVLMVPDRSKRRKKKDEDDQKVVLLTAGFRTCELFIRGMLAAGATISVWNCEGGPVLQQEWRLGPGEYMRQAKQPPAQFSSRQRKRVMRENPQQWEMFGETISEPDEKAMRERAEAHMPGQEEL